MRVFEKLVTMGQGVCITAVNLCVTRVDTKTKPIECLSSALWTALNQLKIVRYESDGGQAFSEFGRVFNGFPGDFRFFALCRNGDFNREKCYWLI